MRQCSTHASTLTITYCRAYSRPDSNTHRRSYACAHNQPHQIPNSIPDSSAHSIPNPVSYLYTNHPANASPDYITYRRSDDVPNLGNVQRRLTRWRRDRR